MQYEVVSIESRTEADRKKTFSLSFPAVSLSTPSDLSSPADAEAEESGKPIVIACIRRRKAVRQGRCESALGI